MLSVIYVHLFLKNTACQLQKSCAHGHSSIVRCCPFFAVCLDNPCMLFYLSDAFIFDTNYFSKYLKFSRRKIKLQCLPHLVMIQCLCPAFITMMMTALSVHYQILEGSLLTEPNVPQALATLAYCYQSLHTHANTCFHHN